MVTQIKDRINGDRVNADQVNDRANGDKPHLLFIETSRDNNPGHWQFRLRRTDGRCQFDINDVEPGVSGERLDLLTIIRAPESLDQPSRVTLASCSPYIRQGVQYGMSEWRENKWQWEFFGYMVPIKNADLWQRMDHLLHVHSVECRQLRMDGPHHALASPNAKPKRHSVKWGHRVVAGVWLKCTKYITPRAFGRYLRPALQNSLQRFIGFRPASRPCPGSS